jgi:hypothetical protein
MSRVRSGSYADASLQVGSISWKNFVASFPDKDTPASTPGGNIINISLASLTGENAYDGEIPIKGAGRAEHVVIELPKGSKGATEMAAFGVDKIDLGFTVGVSYDKTKKSFSLDDYTLTGANAGSFGLKGLFGGIDQSFFTSDGKAKMAALMGSDVSSIAISYKDAGLFPKVLAYFAADQKKSVDDLKAEWTAMATQFLPMMLGGDPSSLNLAAAVGKFIADPKSLTISAKAKAAPVKITDLMSLSDPKEILSKIDLGATPGP